MSLLESLWRTPFAARLKTLTWVFGFAILTALTLNDFFILLYEYKDNNIVTHVEVVVIDENFDPPQLVLQIPIYKSENQYSENLMLVAQHLYNGSEEECDLCNELTKESWDVWNDRNISNFLTADLDTYYHALSMAFVGGLFTRMEVNHTGIFNDSSSPWKEIVFSSVINLFIWQSGLDYYLHPYDTLKEITHLYEEVIPPKKEKLDLLFAQMLSGFCREITIVEYDLKNEFSTAEPTSRTCESLLVNSSGPVILDINGLYIALPVPAGPQIKEYRITLNSGSVWPDSYWTPKGDVAPNYFGVYPDAGVQYVASIDSMYSSHVFSGPVETTDKKARNVTVRYSVQLRAKETRPHKSCYNGTSATVCFTKCTKQYIAEMCGCIPFSSRTAMEQAAEGLEYCSFQDFARCNISGLPKAKKEACIEKCRNACEYTSYSWQVDHDSYEPSHPNVTEITLRIMPTFNTFAQFSWKTKNTAEQFLSQIGGIVNLYLGISGLSLIAFAFICVDFLKHVWEKNQRTQKTACLEKPVESQGDLKKLIEVWEKKMKGDLKAAMQMVKDEIRAEMQKMKDELKNELK